MIESQFWFFMRRAFEEKDHSRLSIKKTEREIGEVETEMSFEWIFCVDMHFNFKVKGFCVGWYGLIVFGARKTEMAKPGRKERLVEKYET